MSALSFLGSLFEGAVLIAVYYFLTLESLKPKKAFLGVFLAFLLTLFLSLLPIHSISLSFFLFFLLVCFLMPQCNILLSFLYAELSYGSLLAFESLLSIVLPIDSFSEFWCAALTYLLLCLPVLLLFLLRRHTRYRRALRETLPFFSPFVATGLLLLLLLGELYLYIPSSYQFSVALSILLFYILLFFVFLVMIYRRELERERSFSSSLRSQIENNNTLITDFRIKSHNYHSHLNHIKATIMTADSLEDLREDTSLYLSSLSDEHTFLDTLSSINDVLFRSLLYDCYTQCQEKKISFSFEATPLLPFFPLKDYEMVEVMTNLFENSIDECLRCHEDNRAVYICLFFQDAISTISITNSTPDAAEAMRHITSQSTKKKTPGHGIGLKGIIRILLPYHIKLSAMPISSTQIQLSMIYKKRTEVHS